MREKSQDSPLVSRANGITMLILATVPAYFWFQSLDSIAVYTDYETPPGQIFYIFSKLLGLYAILLLWLQIMLGLSKNMMFGRRLGINLTLHRNLGIATFAALVLHALLFVLAVSIRKEHFAYGLMLPVFDHGFYRTSVTLGVLALYSLIFTLIGGILKNRGKKWAIWMHRTSLVAFALALAHCLLIGTETRYFAMIALYSMMGGSVAVVLLYRFNNRSMAPQK